MQCIPVYTKEILHSVRQETFQLLRLSQSIPASPMIRPFVHGCTQERNCKYTPRIGEEDWSLVIYLPRKQSFFVNSKGALIYNFNPKVNSCTSDAFTASCKVWNGTILGVEKTMTDWYAVDAFVVAGTNVMHLPFTERQRELQKLKETCMPQLLLVDSIPFPRGTREIPDVALI